MENESKPTIDYLSLIKKIWSENSEKPQDNYTNDDKYLRLKDIIDIISVGDYFIYIVNPFLGKFEYVSDQVQNVLGYTTTEFDLDLFIKIAHPKDLPHVFEIQKKFTEFNRNNILSEKLQYKYCYDFRAKHKDGNYRQLYVQHFYLELSENLNPLRTFCFLSDITHIKNGGIPKLNIFKLGDRLVRILNENQENKIVLTNKESDIFEYLIKGFTSQDIAEALGISKHTVDTHRRNILKKNNCGNTSELLSLYFEDKKASR